MKQRSSIPSAMMNQNARYRGPPTFGVNACTRKWEGCRSRYCIEGKAKGDSLSVQTNPRRANSTICADRWCSEPQGVVTSGRANLDDR